MGVSLYGSEYTRSRYVLKEKAPNTHTHTHTQAILVDEHARKVADTFRYILYII